MFLCISINTSIDAHLVHCSLSSFIMDGYTLPISMCMILIYLEFLYYNLTMVQFKLEFTNTSTIVDQ